VWADATATPYRNPPLAGLGEVTCFHDVPFERTLQEVALLGLRTLASSTILPLQHSASVWLFFASPTAHTLVADAAERPNRKSLLTLREGDLAVGVTGTSKSMILDWNDK
jgi:hypothetical protein